jgi:hypothetical protein
MSLPRHLLEILDPPRRAMRRSPEEGWQSVPISRRIKGSALVDVNYDREIPPWWAGPYREDVPKR